MEVTFCPFLIPELLSDEIQSQVPLLPKKELWYPLGEPQGLWRF
jgi:hypothetical protein